MDTLLMLTNGLIIILGALVIRKDTNKTVKWILTSIIVLATIGLIGYIVGKAIYYATT